MESNGLAVSRSWRKEKWTGCIQTTEKKKLTGCIPAAINENTGFPYLSILCWIRIKRDCLQKDWQGDGAKIQTEDQKAMS